jgi:hypothetical protein
MSPLALALLTLQITSGSAAPPPVCLGPRTAEVEASLPSAGRYVFPGTLLNAFTRLWAAGHRPPLPLPADAVSALATGTNMLTLVYSRGGSTLAVFEIPRGELLRALRTAVGPAI